MENCDQQNVENCQKIEETQGLQEKDPEDLIFEALSDLRRCVNFRIPVMEMIDFLP